MTKLLDDKLVFNPLPGCFIRVKWEPGDATKYDFVFIRRGQDYIIMPYESTFRFPQRLNYKTVKMVIRRYENNEYDILMNVAYVLHGDLYGINPNTIIQVARALYYIEMEMERHSKENFEKVRSQEMIPVSYGNCLTCGKSDKGENKRCQDSNE